MVAGTWVPGAESAIWDTRVEDLKQQIWKGADPVEEATDAAAAAASAEKSESEAELTEEEQIAKQAERDQAAATEKERIWALGVETDAALAALPEGTIVVQL